MVVKKKNSAFMKPVHLSEALEAVVGSGPMPRTEVTKKLWDYIKKNKLQDSENKRNINPDVNLEKIFGGKEAVDMFKMTSLVSKHISDKELSKV
jgi:chromatin remodeling complex protein RSC6